MKIERGRLLRALQLEVTPGGPGCYRVSGGAAEHLVRRIAPRKWRCDCPDSLFRISGKCKHVLAVYFARRLDPGVLAALRSAMFADREAPALPRRASA